MVFGYRPQRAVGTRMRDADELTPINAVENTLSSGAQFMFNILKPLDRTSPSIRARLSVPFSFLNYTPLKQVVAF